MEASTSKEHIIPITLEYDLDLEPVKEEKADISFPKEKPETRNKNQKEEIKLNLERNLPWVNCKEKIIIAIDCAEDENTTNFELDGISKTPLSMLKHCMQFLVRTKHLINKKHEYAVVLLNENNVTWKCNFTNNVNKIVQCLENVQPCEPEDIFELQALFQVIIDNVATPEKCEEDEISIPPPYVVRCILVYGRSYTIPNLQLNPLIKELLSTPYFILDVLMTHEPEGSDNNISKIFKLLQNIDKKGYSYFFSVERNCKKLHNAAMVLLSHPLQRPFQRLANYALKDWKEQ